MSDKETCTVGYIMGLLKYCSPDATVNIMLRGVDCEESFNITSLVVHEDENKKELVSFLNEELSNDE